jgi:hypothetical protein
MGWDGTKERDISWMCFASIYENRRIKPVEIVLRSGRGRKNDGGVNPTKMYFNHICKYYSVSPCTTITY